MWQGMCIHVPSSFGANLHGYLKLGGRKHEIKSRKACDIAVSRVFSGIKRVPVLYKYFPAFPSKFVFSNYWKLKKEQKLRENI